MKLRLCPVLLFTVALFSAANAFAICQTCHNDGTARAMCWTIDPCEGGAYMGACTVDDIPGTMNRTCNGQGSSEGPECNGHDPSCGGGGGGVGGGGGTPPPGVGGVTCIMPASTQWMGCPADCNQCIFQQDLPPWGPAN